MSKIVAAAGVASGLMRATETSKRIEVAMLKAIQETPPKRAKETEAQYTKRIRSAIRKARDKAVEVYAGGE